MPAPAPVVLRTGPRGPKLDELSVEAAQARGDVGRALALADRWGDRLPRPGDGRTRLLWEALATLGATDLTVARAVEPHLDARAILDEAGIAEPLSGSWGVWAAEGPGVRLEALPGPDGWVLSGTKPWCSLADDVTHALVTAWVDDEHRQLFAVELAGPGVSLVEAPWVARGLAAVRSTPVCFGGVPAAEIGEPGWYLLRDGFAWGGMGVAAVWYGATVAVARRLSRQAVERRLDQIGQQHLGVVDAALTAARAVLAAAAEDVDGGLADGDAGALAALRVRQVVADAAETVLRVADHALGPGPLTAEEDHAALVADLHLYLRQHHAERDAAALGRLVGEASPW